MLANDATGSSPIDPTSVKLCGPGEVGPTGCTLTTLTVPGEGTYTVDPVTGKVTFDPLPTFSGVATPVQYTVADTNGLRNTATISVNVTMTYAIQ